MSNIQLLPQFDGNNCGFSLVTNSWWTDIIYFTQPGFGPPVQVAGCGIASGQNVISVPQTSSLFPGMTISSLAAGIPAGAYIGVVSLASITVVALNGSPLNLAASNTDMTLLFNPPPLDLTGINFICNWRRNRWRPSWQGLNFPEWQGTQVFLTCQTGDGSIISGGPLGTLQFNVPHTTINQIPPATYFMDILAFDGIYQINLFQNAPCPVILSGGITDWNLIT